MFLGYNLENQGLDLKVKDDEKREKYAKFILAVVRASDRIPNMDAAQFLHDLGAKTAMVEGTSQYGGYLVPEEYTAEILAFARDVSQALQMCRIWPMSSDVRRIPAELTNISVTWPSEGSAPTESEPTVAEVELTAKKLGAYGIVSNELLQDSMVDVVSWLTEQMGEAKGLELDNQVLNGTGSPCSGILTAKCGYSVVMASETAFSAVTCTYISEMMSKLSEIKLRGAVFTMHRTVFHYLRSAKDSNQAFVYAQPGASMPETIWGLPYRINEKAPTTSAANTAFISLGNWRYFCLGRRLQSMTLDLDPYTYFKESKTQFRNIDRWGLAIGLANGFVRFMTHS
jgi:HK97 family phage major capsid protein